jgi:Na+/melibiose symporter-like transporter
MVNVAALAIGLPILWLGFREIPAPTIRRHVGLGQALRLLTTDRLLLRVIGSDFCVSLGQGFRGALLVIFVVFYMRLPAWALWIPLIQYVFGVFASPIWARIGYRLGKSRTVIAAEFTQIAVNLGLVFLAPGQVWPLVALTVAQGLSQGSGNLMLRAIVSDVADKERLETGKDHSGLLFSIFNVTMNVAMALAIGFALQLAGWFGFQPGRANAPAALEAVKYIITFGPAIGHLLSAFLMVRFPLNEARHAEILAALRRQEATAAENRTAEPDAAAFLQPLEFGA